jgi:hypothetical protein
MARKNGATTLGKMTLTRTALSVMKPIIMPLCKTTHHNKTNHHDSQYKTTQHNEAQHNCAKLHSAKQH